MFVVMVTVALAAFARGEEEKPENFAAAKPYSLDQRDNSTVRAGRMDGKVTRAPLFCNCVLAQRKHLPRDAVVFGLTCSARCGCCDVYFGAQMRA